MEVLVLFASKGGVTYQLAKGVADGIRQVEGVQPRIRRPKEITPIEIIRANPRWSRVYDQLHDDVQEVTLDDLVETEGLALGSPTRYGNILPTMGNFIESAGPLWVSGALIGKAAGVFCSTGTVHGGNETTLISMMLPLMHLGYIIVPLGYTDAGVMTTTAGGTPYGPSAVSTPEGSRMPDETEMHLCRVFGKRLAETALKLRG